ncbi:hypothetical protein [Gluconobacter sp. OJB]
MKIKILKDQTKYKAGDVISVPLMIAKLLIWGGYAEPYTEV